jgi:CubicO group peptidase (beta-lactamase class C family)
MRVGAAAIGLCLALAACAPATLKEKLEATLDTRIAAVGVARLAPDGTVAATVEGCAVFAADGRTCTRAFTADSPVRIASISKLVTAIGAMRLVEEGKLDLDSDVSRYLGFQLRNPAFPDTPITLRQLLAHVSSLRDGGNYIVPLGGNLRAELAKAEHWETSHAPGVFYSYANLGLVIVGTAMEGASGERFDRLMARLVFRPLGLEASYNWSGSSVAAAARAAGLYRTAGDDEVWHRDGPFLPQIDDRGGALPACVAPVVAEGVGCDLDAFPPGTNAGPFSPQGGLRISLNELVVIARVLAGGPMRGLPLVRPETVAAFAKPVWMLNVDGTNGDSARGSECGYGTGLHLLGASPSPACHDDLFSDGRPRIGHAAEAYGLLGGLWIDPLDHSVTLYFVTGTSTDPLVVPGKQTGFRALEEALAETAEAISH